MRFLAVTTLRNEAAFLPEWLAHHRAAGFTDFLVLSNDCDDGTDQMLDRLQEMGEISHLRNDPPHEGGIQWAGLKRADRHPLVQQADWILVLDIDEFVNIHVGQRTLDDLLAALPDATAITLTWRLFGNNGIVDYTDAPVLQQFTRAAPPVLHWPWRAAMFKTLYRNDGVFRKLGVHRPRSPDKPRLGEARWHDGSGRRLADQFPRSRIFSDYGQDNYAMAQLNHYPLGAMQSYLLKRDRGRVNHTDQPMGMDYWVERNFNTDEDRSILEAWPRTEAELSRLLGDPALAALHEAGIAWRRARFDELMALDTERALFGQLMMCPPSQPLDRQQAELILTHARQALRDRTRPER